MSVTHRKLPEDIDPVAHLFGDEKITVPISRLTPEVTVRFYERALQEVDVQSLHNKSDKVPFGLESLPRLLQSYGKKWLRLEVERGLICSALPAKTPYQLQYLVLFGFDFPHWEDIPLVTRSSRCLGAPSRVMGEVETTALLYGKNKQLYLVTARWTPKEGYFGGGREPLHHNISYTFNLSHLAVEVVDWRDARILERIIAGQWSGVMGFKLNLHLVLEATASVLDGRARDLRRAADRFDLGGMSIHSGC